VLGRLHGEPVGSHLVQLPPGGAAPGQLAGLLWPLFRDAVASRFAAAGLPAPAALPVTGAAGGPGARPFHHGHGTVPAAPPLISVVVCARDRPVRLAACLRRLAGQEYPNFEIVVVDNATASGAVAAVAGAHRGGAPCRYVAEPRRGLSWARNAGSAAANGEIIAFLDDDEEPDARWLAGIAAGFTRGGDIGCVTGPILPARLDTPAQEWFEQAGGHSRGFTPAVFSRHGPQNPLFPRPPFGAEGNMAFRREALARIGGFDVALGAGTPARGGEDTLALSQVLLAGYRIAYEPAAFVRHHHHADPAGLGRQLYGYGVGLTAFYLALLRRQPRLLPTLLRLLPAAAAYWGAPLRRRSARPRRHRAPAPPRMPARLRLRRRCGMLAGPLAYGWSAVRQRRAASRGAAA
jgi:GT2 family glycosyltransferase